MAMARIVLGNRDGVLALHQARSVLHQLTDEWPDVHLVLRTLPNSMSADPAVPADELLDALESGSVGIAVVQAETLPVKLPEGLVIAAVSRRLEPRCALLSRTKLEFDELPAGAKIGASLRRDGQFLDAARPGHTVLPLEGTLDDAFALLAGGDLDAVIASAAALHALGHGNRATVLLDPSVLTPAVGQGATALVVRADDDPSFEIAYSLQHRPSFDRLLAERSFAEALLSTPGEPSVGALATVSDDGRLTLVGAVVRDQAAMHVRAVGNARDAKTLGAELGRSLAEQLSAT